MPSFSRYEEEIDADSGYYYFSLKVDFPKSSATNAKAIRKWLMNMIQKEKGDDKGMPNTHDVMMFSELYLPAVVYTPRFVTYRRFTNDYRGGAHGMYTESFISFDHVHRQVIDYDYLFKPGSQNEVMTILIEEAKKTIDNAANRAYWEKIDPHFFVVYDSIDNEELKPFLVRKI